MRLTSELRAKSEDYVREDLFPRVEPENILRLNPGDKSRLVFMTEPCGLAVEQYKLLRRRLNALQPRGGVLLVTSPGPGDGKTLTSVNLSWGLANGGQQTCLVDLDFRAPGVAHTLGYRAEHRGVEGVLTGKRTIGESICQVEDSPFYVLGMQTRHASPEGYLSAISLTPLINDLRAMFHWVILDMAPAIPMSDVAEVMPHVDGALLVVRAGLTRKVMIAKTHEILAPKIWGIVSNESPIMGSAYYGNYGNRNRS